MFYDINAIQKINNKNKKKTSVILLKLCSSQYGIKLFLSHWSVTLFTEASYDRLTKSKH